MRAEGESCDEGAVCWAVGVRVNALAWQIPIEEVER